MEGSIHSDSTDGPVGQSGPSGEDTAVRSSQSSSLFLPCSICTPTFLKNIVVTVILGIIERRSGTEGYGGCPIRPWSAASEDGRLLGYWQDRWAYGSLGRYHIG